MLHDVLSNPTRKEEMEQTREIRKFRKIISKAVLNKEARVWLD
jgi:hypothetical protein